jgi:malate dehydrogenase (oxaloacetate-decarboxylating)
MRFFLSYAIQTDDQLATELKALLRENGHDVFEATPGGDWRAEISAAIRRSDAVIALLTTSSHDIYFELGLAAGAHIPTLVVSPSAEGIPADLTSVPYVQLTGNTSYDVATVVRRLGEIAQERGPLQGIAPQTAEAQLLAAARNPSILERLSPKEFEDLVARLYRERGFTVSVPAGVRDMGVDLVLGSDSPTVVQVKRYLRQNLVSVGTVRQLLGALTIAGAERAIIVSSSGFTNAARALAADAPVELLTLEDLLKPEARLSVATVVAAAVAAAATTAATPSAQYRLTIRVKLDDSQGILGLVTAAIGQAGGIIGAVDAVEADGRYSVRDIVVDASSADHWQAIIASIDALSGAEVINTTDRTFQLHVGGKLEQRNKNPLKTRDDLSMVYTPGVARVSIAIATDPDTAFQYTIRRNAVAVVSDGTAVLGLGDIGPQAALPVMEGKCCLFKEFAGVDAFPVCLDTTDPDEIVRTINLIAPNFGGINLEDISAPRCFAIEEQLKQQLDIPVFHDDQHGTAVVVMAALLNAVKLTERRLEDLHVLIIGLGAAGVAVAKILLAAGVRNIVGCDARGALHVQRQDYLDGSMNEVKRWFAQVTNPECRAGAPADVIDGTDLLIGVSGARALPVEALARMNDDAMVFAMANPIPEVIPEEAAPYVRIMATGRSDYPNQINTVLCFPGIFRGALDVRAPAITEEMKMAAARAIAAIVADEELREDYIIPSVFNREVAPAVAAAVAEQAHIAGTARIGSEVGIR